MLNETFGSELNAVSLRAPLLHEASSTVLNPRQASLISLILKTLQPILALPVLAVQLLYSGDDDDDK